jgi:ribosomal-protein-alanine N-acetyltransferase
LPPRFTFRCFQPADLDRILKIEQLSFTSDAWERELFLEYYLQCPDLFLVARRNRRIAGYVITCIKQKNAELVSIAVDPRDRLRGLGRAMLDETLARLRARRVNTWWLMVAVINEPAIRFYESYGFEPTRRAKRYYGVDRDAWRMRFTL